MSISPWKFGEDRSYSFRDLFAPSDRYKKKTGNVWQSPAVGRQAQPTHPGKDTPLQWSSCRVCCLRSVICNEGVPFRPYGRGVVSAQRVFYPWWPCPMTFDLDIPTRPSEWPNTSSVRICRKSIQRFLPSIVECESPESNAFRWFCACAWHINGRQTITVNSGVSGPKFAKFLFDVDRTSVKRPSAIPSCHLLWNTSPKKDKNSSGDEIANVNFYAVRPEATRIRWNNAK